MRKNGLNNWHGYFCESGIRACPESVGVGKFCRLRLRLREKQPTPTDSDSGSDSDSAALIKKYQCLPERLYVELCPTDVGWATNTAQRGNAAGKQFLDGDVQGGAA